MLLLYKFTVTSYSWVGSPRTALIHPESETAVTAIRQRLPVCLDSVQYGLETNCGHLFCGKSFC